VSAVQVLRAVLQIIRTKAEALVGSRLQVACAREYVLHLLGLAAHTVEARCQGALANRLTDTQDVQRALGQGIILVAGNATALVVAFVLLMAHSRRVGVLVLLSLAVTGATIALFAPTVRRMATRYRDELGMLSHYFLDAIDSIKPAKVFQAEETLGQSILEQVEQSSLTGRRLQEYEACASAAVTLINSATTALVLWLAAVQVVGGGMTTGEIVFVFGLLTFLLALAEDGPRLAVFLMDSLVVIDRPGEHVAIVGVRRPLAPRTGSRAPAKAPERRVSETVPVRGIGAG